MIVVVGAGPAGLALGYHLQRRGADFCMLEQSQAGATWAQHYEHLHLHSLKQVSGLPGYPMPAEYPDFPSKQQFHAYLQAYAAHFALPIRSGVRLEQLSPLHDHPRSAWQLHIQDSQQTRLEQLSADIVVMATGIWQQPYMPHFPGQESFPGDILHANAYQRPQDFAGKRVLVVGSGNSGAEIAVKVSEVAESVGIVIRDGVAMVAHPRSALRARIAAALLRRVPAALSNAYLARNRPDFSHLGLPLPDKPPLQHYPVVGFHLAEAVAAGNVQVYSSIARLQAEQVHFEDGKQQAFDSIILATGYRPALSIFGTALSDDPQELQAGRSSHYQTLFYLGYRYPVVEAWLQAIGRVSADTAQAIVTLQQQMSNSSKPSDTQRSAGQPFVSR